MLFSFFLSFFLFLFLFRLKLDSPNQSSIACQQFVIVVIIIIILIGAIVLLDFCCCLHKFNDICSFFSQHTQTNRKQQALLSSFQSEFLWGKISQVIENSASLSLETLFLLFCSCGVEYEGVECL